MLEGEGSGFIWAQKVGKTMPFNPSMKAQLGYQAVFSMYFKDFKGSDRGLGCTGRTELWVKNMRAF